MTQEPPDLWSGADAYDRYMGRWSRKVAPLFLDWLAVPAAENWLDIGCGTGVLSSSIIERCAPSSVLGVDQADRFLQVARSRIADQRFAAKVGSATELPGRDGAFGAVVSGLVLNFVPNAARAASEMARVVKPGGKVGLYVWDYAGHMQVMRHFFDVATALDPAARHFDDGVNAPVCRPVPLRQVFETAGLGNVEVTAIDITAAFRDFDDYWSPFLGGTGSAPKYCATLSTAQLGRLREALRSRLPTGPDGEILLAVRAWAVTGTAAPDRQHEVASRPIGAAV